MVPHGMRTWTGTVRFFKATERASALPGEAGEEGASMEMEKLREVLGLGGPARWERWVLPTHKILDSTFCANKSKRDNDAIRVNDSGLK